MTVVNFVIGNGESRQDVDLNEIKSKGKVFGCNAIYRDFSPDVLVCVDNKIIFEVIKSGYCKNGNCAFSDWSEFPSEMYESFQTGGMSISVKYGEEGSRFSIFGNDVEDETIYIVWLNDEKIIPFENEQRYGAGSNAIQMASSDKPEIIYLLGFDIYSKDGKMNNIFKDTECYNSSNSSSKSPDKWIQEMNTIFTENPLISFIRVSNEDNNPVEWDNTNNIKRVSYAELWDELGVYQEVLHDDKY